MPRFDEAFARPYQLALGLPLSEPLSLIREDDRELYALVAAARDEGVSDAALLRALRAFGPAIRGIVAAQRDLFRESIEEPLLEGGMTHQDLLRRTAPTRLRLQRVGYRVVFLLLRRVLEEAVFENVVARLEDGLAEAGLGRQRDAAEGRDRLADLSGFTRLTEGSAMSRRRGESARFIELAQNVSATFHGRLVKPLGDGVMLHFKAPGPAVACLAELVRPRPGLCCPRSAPASPPVRW